MTTIQLLSATISLAFIKLFSLIPDAGKSIKVILFSFKKTLRRIFLTWVYRHIDTAFYVGTNNKAYYRAHGVGDNRLIYAPHAIDNDRFNDSNGNYTKQATEWKKSLQIQSNRLTVLFAGKLEPKKNPMFMVEAARVLKQMHFIIIGNGILEIS